MQDKKQSRQKRNKIWEPPLEEFREVVKNSIRLIDILKHYNVAASSGHYTALKDRLRRDQIDFSHIKLGLNSNKGRTDLRKSSLPLEQVLVEHSAYSRRSLKERLFKLNLLENKCYECGLGSEWQGKPLSLQLDHINGVSDDNRLENLRILCPNCHAQTETFGAKRRKGTGKPQIKVSDTDPNWRHNPKLNSRKVERPSRENLNKLLWEMPLTTLAKQFGVSDNAVIKWAAQYGLSRPPFGYWQRMAAQLQQSPSKEELQDLLWKMTKDEICSNFKIAHKTLLKWIKEYNLTCPPNGHWKKKENIKSE